MGKNDIATRQFFENSTFFADAVNGYLFRGRKVIRPEELREMDVTEISPPRKKNLRDIFERAVIKENGEARYLLIGIENQQKTDLTMPVRCISMDTMSYEKQLRELKQLHREKKDLAPFSDEQFSGISKDDRLIPAVTIVVNWSSSPWSGPRTLHDMLKLPEDADISSSVQDYRINLIDAHSMSDDEIAVYGEKLGFLLTLVRESENKTRLRRFMESKTILPQEDEVRVVAEAVLDVKLPEKREEDDRMCDALKEILKEEREQGIEQGIERGLEQGFSQGRQRTESAFVSAMRKTGFTEEQIDAIVREATV